MIIKLSILSVSALADTVALCLGLETADHKEGTLAASVAKGIKKQTIAFFYPLAFPLFFWQCGGMTPPRYVLALPKGRILKEFQGILEKTPLRIEDDFYDDACRKLMFATNRPDLSVIRVRSFDVATFVRYGAAHLGVAGMDAIAECQDPDVYVPLNLGIGACRLSVAAPEKWADSEKSDPFWHATHIRVATKYPSITQRHYAQKGIQAECIKLNGAMELAPALGLCRRIVDLVSSGETLRMNGLKELETLMPVTAHVIVNRTAYKLYPDAIGDMIQMFQGALS